MNSEARLLTKLHFYSVFETKYFDANFQNEEKLDGKELIFLHKMQAQQSSFMPAFENQRSVK